MPNSLNARARLSEFSVQPWNMKEFYIHDPHGNLLRFGCARRNLRSQALIPLHARQVLLPPAAVVSTQTDRSWA